MNRVFFTIFLGVIFGNCLAQNNNPFDNTHWYLGSMYINGTSYDKPDKHDAYSNLFGSAGSMFGYICETGGIAGHYDINVEDLSIIFTDIDTYDGDCLNEESIIFRNLLFSFYENHINTPLEYDIVLLSDGSQKLTFTSSDGNHIVYTDRLNYPPEIILANDWYLRKLIINGDEYVAPSNEEVPYVFADFKNLEDDYPGSFYTNVCGYINGLFDFQNNSTEFYLFQLEEELTDCNPNGENSEFQQLYFDFFQNNYYEYFQYLVTENTDGSIALIITDTGGNQAIYSNQQMSVVDVSKNDIKYYPNPVKDKLVIENPDLNITSVCIADFSRKIVFSSKEFNSDKIEIDFKSFPNGVYFVTTELDGKKLITEKVLKK